MEENHGRLIKTAPPHIDPLGGAIRAGQPPTAAVERGCIN